MENKQTGITTQEKKAQLAKEELLQESVSSNTPVVSGGYQTPLTNVSDNITNLKGELGQKIYKTDKQVGHMIKQMATDPIRQSGDAGHGAQFVLMGAADAKGITGDVAKTIMNAGLKSSLKQDGINSIEDVQSFLKETNQILKDSGCKTQLRVASNPKKQIKGKELNQNITKIKKELKKKGLDNPDIMERLNKAKDISNKTRFQRSGKKFRTKRVSLKRIRGQGFQQFTRKFRQSEAGEGYALVMDILKKSRKTLKRGLKLAQYNLKAARFASRKMLYASTRLALRAAKSAMVANSPMLSSAGHAVTAASGKARRLGQKANKNVKKVTKAPKKIKGKITAPFRKVRDKATKKITSSRIGVALKKARKKIANKLANTFVGRAFHLLGTAFRAVTTVFSKLIGAISAILVKVLIIATIVIVVVGIVTFILQWVAGLFDFGASDKEIREAAVSEIAQCYQADLNYMADLANSGKYETVNVSYEDIRNDKSYEKHLDEEKRNFTETTNCAEILSMALIRFDFDFEDAGKGAVTQYVRELYYGTHELQVTESSDGKVAKVTYRTYYFDYMFDKELSQTPIITNTTTCSDFSGYAETEDDVYVFLRDKGFTHAGAVGMMANIQRECGFNENTGNRSGGYGLCQWTNGRYDALMEYCRLQGYDHTSRSGQLSYALKEMSASYSDLFEFLKKNKDPKDCGMSFQAVFEGNEWNPQKYPSHANYSHAAYTGTLRSSLVGKEYVHMDKTIAYVAQYDSRYSQYKKDYSKLAGGMGDKIAKEARGYAGKLHYRWGGTSLTSGADCSGFVFAMYAKYGISIPHGSVALRDDTAHMVSYKEMKPGDIVVVWGNGSDKNHVGMYVGNGEFVNSANNNCGISGAHNGCSNDCIISRWTESNIKKSKDGKKQCILRYWK